MIGRTLSHYRITEKLGEGGMGVVYRARDETLDRDVALKILPEEVSENPDRLARFEREAKTVAALNHPNIVTLFSVEKEDGINFLTMELVEGQALSEVLTSKGLPLDHLFELTIPLADAVNSAHSKGVAHRDLKPANIMIDGEGRVKILDFGLAKLFDPDIGQSLPADGATIDMTSTPTVEGKILGTPDYMSPEQAEGKPVDHRSDIFSLGIILYEMATGNRPFRGDSPAGTISSILRDTPIAVTDLKTDLPNHLGRIIGRCLDKRPERRYQSTLDLRNDLAGLKRETEAGTQVIENGPGSNRFRNVMASIFAVAALALVFWQFQPGGQTSDVAGDIERKMLVVLPFENLGPPEDEYFADGITEEITAKVSGVEDLGVIARTSAMKFKNTEKTVAEIGKELGVGYVLEGTIRWQRLPDGKSLVRVTPQLIQVSDETQMWADFYQDDLEDIFQVQSDIAERVVRALDVTLREPERRALASNPTANIEAYNAYIRGLDFFRHPSDTEEKLGMAVRMMERAVELDPDFALAYCQMAIFHAAIYYYQYDRTPERLAKAKEAIDRAQFIRPGVPEAHLALGWYHYWGFRKYDLALSEFGLAANYLPNDSSLHNGIAAVLRRQGHWNESIDHHSRACKLDPQDAHMQANAGWSLMAVRRYQEAEPYFDRSISLVPDQFFAYLCKAQLLCLWKGDIEGARNYLNKILVGIDTNFRLYVEIDILGRDYPAVLDQLKIWSGDFIDNPYYVIPKDLYVGLINSYMGNTEPASVAFNSALTILSRSTENHPLHWSHQSSLGIAFAGLGRKEEAIEAGREATRLFPLESDYAEAFDPLIYLAQIYTMVGEYDAAIDVIEDLLNIPSDLSVPILKLDPRWDPLHDIPRFQFILREYSQGDS